MMQWVKRLILITLCVVLAGCQNNRMMSDGKKQKAMGRYVEETCKIESFMQKKDNINFWYGEDEKLHALIHNEQFEEYVLDANGEWKEINSDLCRAINSETANISSIEGVVVGDTTNTYYIVGEKVTKSMNKGYLGCLKNNQLNEIKLEGKEGEQYPNLLYAKDVSLNHEGKFIYCNQDEGVEIYGEDGKLQEKIDQRMINTVVADNEIMIISNNQVELYDLNTYKKIKDVDNIKCGFNDCVFADNKGDFFIANEDGVIRISKDGEIVEKIIDGNICSLSTLNVDRGIAYNDRIYLIYSRWNELGGRELKIKQYSYHEDVPTIPEETLTVWTVRPSQTIKDAVNCYRQQHPDVCVSVEALYDEVQYIEQQSEIRTEDLERLNTELLAGKGPDLMILDGMPIEAYRKEGLFTDLTKCIEESNQKAPLLGNIAKSYCQDGEIYAIPLKFSLITAIGEKELIKNGFNLKEMAMYQEGHKDENVLFPICSSQRIPLMLDLWQSKLFDKQGKLDTQELADYLSALKSILKVQGQDWGDNWRVSFTPEGALVAGIMKADIVKATSVGELQSIASELEKMPNCTISNQVEDKKNIVQAQQIIAINKNSKMQNQAKDFIQIALSGEVQRNKEDIFGDGFSINEQVLTEEIMKNNQKSSVTRISWESLGAEGLSENTEAMKFGYTDEMKYFLNECKTATVLYSIDEFVRHIICEEGESYIKEEITLEEAVRHIEKKIELYTMEQQINR